MHKKSGLGFGRPKPVFPDMGGKNWDKPVFPGFWTVLDVQNWEILGNTREKLFLVISVILHGKNVILIMIFI